MSKRYSFFPKLDNKLFRLAIPFMVSVCIVMQGYAQTLQTTVPLYGVYEVSFKGPYYGAKGSPVAEVELYTEWTHESEHMQYRIYGFWDSDGKGGASGDLFKVRFCPTQTGKWTLVKTVSNKRELDGQNEGLTINCTPSGNKGFWEVDNESAGGRWFKRSDGSHDYICGNTMYSFLSGYYKGKLNGSSIAKDVRENGIYFNKLRFGITGDLYPNPRAKPFLDREGIPTDNGNFSHRPNPKWFFERVDLAVREAFMVGEIADIILNGPDVENSRSILTAGENDGDNTPFLRYMAARYGSYPNVWMCLSNEFDIRKPAFTPGDIVKFGNRLQSFLPYSTPVSVHPSHRDWYSELNAATQWNTHVIIQKKMKKLNVAADALIRNYVIGGGDKPVINDELAYEGRGDGWSEEDVVESHLGAFLGGGYGTTGYKPANKEGHYFAGNFDAALHSAADNLLWLREMIDSNITFWEMRPDTPGIFRKISDDNFRAMAWNNNEYVLGTNEAKTGLEAQLPPGTWRVTRYDAITKDQKILSSKANGKFVFDAPESRAVLFHFEKIDR